ncbi:MAG: Holliday junction resolvase RuvX [Cytophagaceae bacterium]|jgi:putative Holliday junction resolvase|nr:Holliday junction resolvase RuvX [Cytophagaceae bacterium]
MGRLLAIDYGRKRTGLAVSDPLKIIATALETVETNVLLLYLKKYCFNEPVDHFIMGMPRQLNNEESDNAKYVKAFALQLQQAFPEIPLTYVDERFTSRIAQDTLLQGGMKKKDRQNKSTIDKISAVLILQTFMQQSR